MTVDPSNVNHEDRAVMKRRPERRLTMEKRKNSKDFLMLGRSYLVDLQALRDDIVM